MIEESERREKEFDVCGWVGGKDWETTVFQKYLFESAAFQIVKTYQTGRKLKYS